jgi:two-component system, OmpR family, sensor histidine kinase KdpD
MARWSGWLNPQMHSASRVLVHEAMRLSVRILASLVFIAAITLVCFRLIPVNATTTGFFYLVAILVIATAGGLLESTIASIFAMLCFNYFFLPPIGTFTVADPQNWVALFAFLATSLTASQLSARAKRRTREAVDRQHEIERLYSLSRALLLTDTVRPVAKQIVEHIAHVFEFPSVALYDRNSRQIYWAGVDDRFDVESQMHDVAVRSVVFRNDNENLIVSPVRLGGQPIGSLAIRGPVLSDAALQSMLTLVAIGLERAVSQEAVNRAEVARRSEELKSTLLDAIAHEFKTPLTSAKAVTTDLLATPGNELHQHQRELIGIADESVDRMSRLVSEAIQLARIEGGTFRLNRGAHFPSSLISTALKQMKSLTDGRKINVCVPDDLPVVSVDAELIQMVISHLIDNALKYSPQHSAIEIGARADQSSVIVFVNDRGAGIAEDEQSRIFDKFYRGKSERHLKGTGMGLAIAREIIGAHGGEISVTSRPGEGSHFWFSLPAVTRTTDE